MIKTAFEKAKISLSLTILCVRRQIGTSLFFRSLPEGNFYANVSWPDGRSYTGPIAEGVLEGEGASVVIPPRDVYT